MPDPLLASYQRSSQVIALGLAGPVSSLIYRVSLHKAYKVSFAYIPHLMHGLTDHFKHFISMIIRLCTLIPVNK